MELETRECNIKASRQHFGTDILTVNPGEWFQIRKGLAGSPEEVLEVQCPNGVEPWKIVVTIAINESDA